MDTSGMLCNCGKKLMIVSKDDGGCYVLSCPDSKCGMSYKIPIVPGNKLPFPWETKRKRIYNCKKCRIEIDEAQAKQTYNDFGRAMCQGCCG